MSQILAVALDGVFGAVIRFLVSTGIYQWLGRGFPYGALVVTSVGACLFSIWTGLLFGRGLFYYADGGVQWSGAVIPMR